MKSFRVVTLNMLDDEYRRQQRLELLIRQAKKLKPDILMLQEAALDDGVPERLAEAFPSYHLSMARRGGRYRGYGLITMSRQKPIAIKELRLSQKRVALKTTLKLGKKQVDFINLHLFFSPVADSPRQRQIKKILDFASEQSVIAGDFNAMPAIKSIKMMHVKHDSAYKTVYGHEPARTYPTPLWRGKGMRHSLRRGALRASSMGHYLKDPGWGWTLDYIFVHKGVSVNKCLLAFDEPSDAEPDLYISDHYGLVADLQL